MTQIQPSFIYSEYFHIIDESVESESKLYRGLFARRGANGLYCVKEHTIDAYDVEGTMKAFSPLSGVKAFFNGHRYYTRTIDEVIDRMTEYEKNMVKYKQVNVVPAVGGWQMPKAQALKMLRPSV